MKKIWHATCQKQDEGQQGVEDPLVDWKDITDEEAKMLLYISDQLTPVRTIIDDK